VSRKKQASGTRSRRRRLISPRVAGLLAGATTALAWRSLQSSPAAADPDWLRQNFRDRDVSLLLGPAAAAGAVVGLAAAVPAPRRGAVLAVAAIGLVGAYDDRYGDSHARGLGGHLDALRHGRVTTGMVKLVTMGGVAAAASRRQHRKPIDALLGTVLVAGSANLVNLFDLRPGRAAKVTGIAAFALSRVGDPTARAVASVAGSVAGAALGPDVREQAMLGDCGAGALGATLGWSLATRPSRLGRIAAASGVVAATLASERKSFSAVIEANPVLRTIDGLGRVRDRRGR
jgi:UDP-N-acetylmuramyl pentapeptide phosphotransferase/UDP-N-acetylglucosamine-1-phosphate transferase